MAIFTRLFSFTQYFQSQTQISQRNLLPDVLRGLACVLMAIFHFGFDLGQFGLIYFSFEHPFWMWFRFIIVTLFLTMVGYGLYQSYHKRIQFNKVSQRFIKVGGAAFLISLFSYLFAPSQWIFFGILHFIAIASLILIPMVRIPWIALAIGLLILIAYPLRHHLVTDNQPFCDSSWFWFQFKCVTAAYNNWAIASEFWLTLPPKTMDLLKFFPWIGMVMIGIWLGKVELFKLSISSNKATQGLAFLGRHSLMFYLLHQVILFPIAWGIYLLVA